MRRQVQEIGVKKYFGDDLVSLQEEPLRAIEALIQQYGNCIINGCNVSENGNAYNVSAGMVALSGKDYKGKSVFYIVPFTTVDNVPLPGYLILNHTIEERVYGDGNMKPAVVSYYASLRSIKPTDIPYIEITPSGANRFVDVLQDASHRFVTDSQKTIWSAKATNESVESKVEASLTSAKAYTNSRENAITTATDTKDATILRSANESADIKTEASLRASKSYTDSREVVIYTATDAKDVVVLRSAKDYADLIVAALIDGSPNMLNTLKELAAALGNDPNFATTVLNKIAEKAPINHSHTPAQVGSADVNHTHTLVALGAASSTHTHTAAQVGASASNHSHALVALGAAASVHTHDDLYVRKTGGTFSGYVSFPAGAGTGSDMRYKRGIKQISPVLEHVKKAEIFSYDWEKEGEYKIRSIGISAQYFKNHWAEIVHEDTEGTLSVEYSKISVIALKAIQELEKRQTNFEAKTEKAISIICNKTGIKQEELWEIL